MPPQAFPSEWKSLSSCYNEGLVYDIHDCLTIVLYPSEKYNKEKSYIKKNEGIVSDQ